MVHVRHDGFISTCNNIFVFARLLTGEHLVVDDCDVALSSPSLVLNTAALQKALHPLQQQQHDIAEQLTALNSRLSALQADLSRHSTGLLGAGLLNGNDIILAAVLLLQLLVVWWFVRPGVLAEHEAHRMQ